MAPILSSATLTPLRKAAANPQTGGEPAADGTRPIAAGECLRRLVAKVLMHHPSVTQSLKDLCPLQTGVGVRNACSLTAMGLQQMVDDLHSKKEERWGLLQIDLTNAFNSMFRASALDSVRRRCPSALPWLESCYSQHSRLFCGKSMLPSARGAQQGDPCGHALFAWGLQDMLED
jgi:hypothetical protein